MIRFGSVCSGIEAASVAWEPLGWRADWLAEIEAFPSAVLAYHYPTVPNLGDMTLIAENVANDNVPAPDVLVGGTPCQAFSVAGARKGLADDRGFLTIKYVELADAIDKKRAAANAAPAIIVWENVPGVLSSKDNAFGAFLGLLCGEECELQPPGKKWQNAGYVHGPKRTIAWRVIDAQYFGVAQRRRRVFVVASARAGFDPAKVLFESDGVRRDFAPSREQGQSVAALTACGVGTCGADDNQGQAGHLQSVGCWWDGGQLSQTLDAVLAKGQTMPEKNRFPAVLQPTVVGFNHNAQADQLPTGQRDTTISDTLTGSQQAAAEYSVALRGRDGGSTAEIGGEVGDCLRASGGGGGGDKPHVLAPSVSYGIPGNWIGRAPENGGNATEPHHDRSPCLTSTDRHGVATEMAVRRLTPTECERLQGFPDGYTLVPHRNKPASDGPRYKALGNSMAVPCMQWIGTRIAAQLTVTHANDNQPAPAEAVA